MDSNNNSFDFSGMTDKVPFKWYDWVIFAEAALLIVGGIVGSFTAGDIIMAIIEPIIALSFFVYPAYLSRKCRKKGWNKASAVIAITTIIGLGLIGIFIYSGVSGYKSGGNDYSTSTSIEKKCSSCGKPAPYTAKVGDVCAYCGVRWSDEKTIDMR